MLFVSYGIKFQSLLNVFMLFQITSNHSIYSLYYVEACYEFFRPISASLRPGNTTSLSKKCRSGGEPLVTLCSILLARELNLRLLALEPNAIASFSIQLYLYRQKKNFENFVNSVIFTSISMFTCLHFVMCKSQSKKRSRSTTSENFLWTPGSRTLGNLTNT